MDGGVMEFWSGGVVESENGGAEVIASITPSLHHSTLHPIQLQYGLDR
jgi:hypothetical protein